MNQGVASGVKGQFQGLVFSRWSFRGCLEAVQKKNKCVLKNRNIGIKRHAVLKFFKKFNAPSIWCAAPKRRSKYITDGIIVFGGKFSSFLITTQFLKNKRTFAGRLRLMKIFFFKKAVVYLCIFFYSMLCIFALPG